MAGTTPSGSRVQSRTSLEVNYLSRNAETALVATLLCGRLGLGMAAFVRDLNHWSRLIMATALSRHGCRLFVAAIMCGRNRFGLRVTAGMRGHRVGRRAPHLAQRGRPAGLQETNQKQLSHAIVPVISSASIDLCSMGSFRRNLPIRKLVVRNADATQIIGGGARSSAHAVSIECGCLPTPRCEPQAKRRCDGRNESPHRIPDPDHQEAI